MAGNTRYVVFRKSDTPSQVPTPSQINEGDLAVNTADKKVYTIADGVLVDLTDSYSQDHLDTLLDGKLDVSDKYTDTEAVSAVHADVEWKASDWNTAYGWGDHSTEGYLKSVSWGDVQAKPVFSQVATSGSYNDLVDTPSLGSSAAKDVSFFDKAGSANAAESRVNERINNRPDPLLLYFL